MRRILVIDRGSAFGDPAGHQVHGFDMYSDELQKRLGLRVDRATAFSFEHIERVYQNRHPETEAVFFLIHWSDDPNLTACFFSRLHNTHPRPRLLFVDYYAQTSTPHFGVLPYIDVYIKRQCLRDIAMYQTSYDGGYIFTDYLKNNLGFDLKGWYFGSTPDPKYAHKIVTGWNLGVTSKYRRMLAATRPFLFAWSARPFVINRRVGIASASNREWYQEYRSRALAPLASLENKVTMTGQARVSPRRYLAELILSKIVISPFGWGELCFRDYEAVAAGSLLIKPSMDHLVTRPDIFKPHKTYAPVRWDFEDLVEVCKHYVRRPRQAMAIVRNAQAALSDYYNNGGFVSDVQRVLDFNDFS